MYIKTKEPFGTTAVRLGYAESADIVAVLREQEEREMRGDKSPMIGEIMIELGILDAGQVATVLNQGSTSFYDLSEDAVRLAARLEASKLDREQVIMVSGGTENLRTSRVTCQLALALALMKRASVLVVDTFLRKEKEKQTQRGTAVHEFFEVGDRPGFADLLAGGSTIDEAIKTSRLVGLDLLTAGGTTDNNITLLMSERCSEVMSSLRRRYRYILLDGPPLLARADAPVIASRADGIVLVVVSGQQRRSEVGGMMDLAAGLNQRVLGAILYLEK